MRSDRTDERRINLKLSDSLHARLKAQAALRRQTLLALVQQWLEERLESEEAIYREGYAGGR